MVYKDFKLGSKTLSQFYGTLYNGEGQATVQMFPDITVNTTELVKQHGQIVSDVLAKTRVIKLSVYIEKDGFDVNGFKGWLYNNGKKQTFNFVGDTKEIDVLCTNMGDLKVYNTKQFTCDIELVAYNPFWRVINEMATTKTNINSITSFTMLQSGNVDSLPNISITPLAGSTTVKMEVNGVAFTLTNVTRETIIDCGKEEVYEMVGAVKVLCTQKYTSDAYYTFPTLLTTTNTVRLTQGSLSRLVIEPNSRII